MATQGKSKAQDKLAGQIAEAFPFSHIEQEVFINRIIEAHGYTVDEMKRELGHKPHKMFVDIYMRTSDGDYAFEYNGEQHYAQVGNMTATKKALDVNQMLDREKAWILTRIGVPIVQVPYDAYIDDSVLDHLIEEAVNEVSKSHAGYYRCDICGREFPDGQIAGGLCKSCQEREKEKQREYAEKQRAEALAEAAENGSRQSNEEYKEMMKERARGIRRERYRQMKESPEYQRMKAEAKERRKAAYKEQKRRMRELREAKKNEE